MRGSLRGCLQPHVVGAVPGTTNTRLYGGPYTGFALSGGNLVATSTDPNATAFYSERLSPTDGSVTVGAQSGKKYIEIVNTRTSGAGVARGIFGLMKNANIDGVSGKLTQDNLYGTAGSYGLCGIGYNGANIGYVVNGVSTADAAYTYAYGDVIGIAVDFSTGKVWFSKNGTWIQGDPATGASPTLTLPDANFQFVGTTYLNANVGSTYVNTWRPAGFQQTYAPPSGFSAYG